jgi:hypothetical protein
VISAEITEEKWKKLQQFKKVIDAILGESLKSDSEYLELVLTQGLASMIRDILPKEETTLQQEMINLFNENPEFISKHIVETLNRGKDQIQDETKERWHMYS